MCSRGALASTAALECLSATPAMVGIAQLSLQAMPTIAGLAETHSRAAVAESASSLHAGKKTLHPPPGWAQPEQSC